METFYKCSAFPWEGQMSCFLIESETYSKAKYKIFEHNWKQKQNPMQGKKKNSAVKTVITCICKWE